MRRNRLARVTVREMDGRFAAQAVRQAVLSRKTQSRRDGGDRNPPPVGVVVVTPRWRVVTRAHRSGKPGQRGDHAEFVALVKQLRGRSIRGCTIYTTLEPCYRVRRPPKKDCAERIVRSGADSVVIGLSDPDPRVCGAGIRYLLDHGVSVRRFARPLLREAFTEALGWVTAKTLDAIASGEGKRFLRTQSRFAKGPSLGFVNAIEPDKEDIKQLAKRFVLKGPTLPSIRWPECTEVLWQNALLQRMEALCGYRRGGPERRAVACPDGWHEGDVAWIEAKINFCWRLKRELPHHIKSLWSRISPIWKRTRHRASNFYELACRVLAISNASLIRALHPVQRRGTPVAYAPAARWGSARQMFKDLHGCEEPLYSLAIKRVGGVALWSPSEPLVYAPVSAIKSAWRDADLNSGYFYNDRMPGLYLEYILPQVEFFLMTRGMQIQYSNSFAVRRVADERECEIGYECLNMSSVGRRNPTSR